MLLVLALGEVERNLSQSLFGQRKNTMVKGKPEKLSYMEGLLLKRKARSKGQKILTSGIRGCQLGYRIAAK